MSRPLRLGIDVQTLETNERTRGIGRLCERTIRLLAAQHPEIELRLFGAGPAPSVSIAPMLNSRITYSQIRGRGVVQDHLRHGCASSFLWSTPDAAGLDLYHVTSPLMFDMLLPVSGPCPITATLLDAIPAVMQHRGTPLFDKAAWRRYQTRVNVIRSYQQFLPISRSASDDCARYLDLIERKMTVTYVPIEQNPAGELPAKDEHAALARYKLHPGYVVTVTGFNARKNIHGTLRLYAKLSPGLREKNPLVVICSLNAEEARELANESERLGIAKNTVFTGYVSDQDLLALVRNASVMVFASLYEGFGIPVAEAMTCGTPVVVADNSSLPEVVGEAGILIDSKNEEGFAAAIEKLLLTPVLRQMYAGMGFLQAEQFSPENYVRRLIAGYRRAMREKAPISMVSVTANPRPRIAVFSPLPPQASGIAEYSHQLLRQLEGKLEADCFVENAEAEFASDENAHRRLEASSFARRHAVHPYDAILYQIGNNRVHAYMLPIVEKYPGIAVLHDFSLMGLYHWMAREKGQRFDGAQAFAENYPESASVIKGNDEALDSLNLEKYSMTRRISQNSEALIVHSEWLKGRLNATASNQSKTHLIPLGADIEAADAVRPSRDELRRRFLLPEDSFVIVSIGVINRFKRVAEVLDTFAEFHRNTPNVFFILSGPADPGTLKQLMSFCASGKLKHCVRFAGYCDNAQMHDTIAIADVCANLRFPTMGESSATLMNIMAMGKPALVTPVGQFLELPDNVCWKVRIESESGDLLEYLRYLHSHPDAGEELGKKAREFAMERSWDKVAAKYMDVISTVITNRRN